MTVAASVSDAYFDQLRRHDEAVWTHPGTYVERQRAGAAVPVHLRLRDELLRAKGDIKRLVTGQVGVGKSTELHELVVTPDLGKRYQIVVIDAATRLNLARFVDVRFVLVAFAEALARKIRETPGQIGRLGVAWTDPGRLRQWVRILGDDRGLPDPNQVSATEFLQGLSSALTGWQASIRTDDSIRERLVAAEVAQVRDLMVALHDQLFELGGREVLLIVDDLDKIRDRPTLEHLFRDHLGTLRGLPLKWVMTMPYALRFDPALQIPTSVVLTLPNVKVVRRDAPGTVLPEAERFFRALIDSLVVPELVDDAVVRRAALLSAGIPREFLRVVHKAFGVAHYSDAVTVGTDHLERAEAEMRAELQPLHAARACKLRLELVRIGPDELDAAQRELMANLLVVELVNDRQWYDVHPLLADEYDARLAERAARLNVSRDDRAALEADILQHLSD